MTAAAGEAFGRYELVEQIGEGGMAVVHRAVMRGPEGFQRAVVIKRILPALSRDPRFTDMLLAEARLCGLLHHPAIVPVTEVGEVDGAYFLAMEYVEGHDLARVLERCAAQGRPLPAGLACHVAAELAGALAYAHALKDPSGRPLEIVHRDLSPSNVMLSALGSVKLLDFGIARAKSQVRDERTRTGTLKGKLSYMSPEQADGQPIDRRTDIFALGIILYECLTIERLFRGGDDMETLRRVREAKVWPPSSVRPELEPDVDAVVLKLLQRTPEARFQTCDEVAAALSPIVHKHQADAAALRRFVDALGPFEPRALTPSGVEGTAPAKRKSTPAKAASTPSSEATPAAPSSPAAPAAPSPAAASAPAAPATPAAAPGRRPVAALWAIGLTVALLFAAGFGLAVRKGPATASAVDAGAAPPAPERRPPVPPVAAEVPPARRAGPMRIAVVPFKNLGDDKALAFLSEGIGDTVATLLGRMHTQLRLVERNQLDRALAEIALGQTKYADQRTATELGRLTGVEVVILGGFQRSDGLLRVSCRFVDAASGEVLDTLALTRPATALFDVQDAVAAELRQRLLLLLSK